MPLTDLSGDGPGDTERWSVVLPIKGGRGAKSRLGAAPGLALALALDSVDAALGSPVVARVIVVTGAEEVARAVHAEYPGERVTVVVERRPGAGLLDAIRDGVTAVGSDGGPVAVLLPDVPAARSDDVTTALEAAARMVAAGAAMVALPDAEGDGTVLLAAADPSALRPAFGAHSLAAHRWLGAAVLDLELPRLRRDVDTSADLDGARTLGLGRRTREALGESPTLAGCRPPSTGSTRPPPPAQS